jgi:TRAP-type mannitol/chloroaromatic compound transport system permease small subunit
VNAAPAGEPPIPQSTRLELPSTRFATLADSVVTRTGEAISWIWLVLLAVIVANVTLRYAFGSGRIEFEELQWHLYSVGFLIGLSYCAQADAHIRVDVLRDRMPARIQAWIELYGLLLLLFPFIALMLLFGVPFVADSFARSEVSASPGGLAYRWAIKGALVLGFALLGLASASRLSRVWAFLFREPQRDTG